MNLENITSDFLDSNNVTGEVMNLDDFLKELQVNELVEHAEASRRGDQHPPQHLGHEVADQRFQQPLIRPTNIESLKEQQSMGRPSVMQAIGRAPELHLLQGPPEHGMAPGEGGLGGHQGGPREQGHVLPQASVRPQVRVEGQRQEQDHRLHEATPPDPSKSTTVVRYCGILLIQPLLKRTSFESQALQCTGRRAQGIYTV